MSVNTSPPHRRSATSKSLDMFTARKLSPPAPSSSSTPSITCTMIKMKNIIQNLIFSHICRVVRALSKAKSIFLDTLRGNHQFIMYLKNQSNSHHEYRKKKYRNKVLFGSFRLHYNWCSSSAHILPMPSPAAHHVYKDDHIYYDSTWNSVFSTHDHDQVEEDIDDQYCNMNTVNEDKGSVQDYNGRQQQQQQQQDSDAYSELSSYLQWLEEQVDDKSNPNSNKDGNMNEIDMLADMFIKNCHEKFRLEKIESYRRYQEMLARSM